MKNTPNMHKAVLRKRITWLKDKVKAWDYSRGTKAEYYIAEIRALRAASRLLSAEVQRRETLFNVRRIETMSLSDGRQP
jgi:hypothetical protein